MIDNSIHEEYEKIFGAPQKPVNLFDTDEEYEAVRQYVVNVERIYDVKKNLPFSGVEICSYEDFKRNEIVRDAQKMGYRVFYIRRYLGKELTTYAAGFFNPRTSRFEVLKGAFFNDSVFFKSQLMNMSIQDKLPFLNHFRRENGKMYLKHQYTPASASLFASLLLGKKSTFREWYDERHKTLDAYYQKYKNSAIDETEAKTFPDYVEPPTFEEVFAIPKPTVKKTEVPKEKVTEAPKEKVIGKHFFYLHKYGVYNAYGYHDTATGYFYICQNSKVATAEASDYAGSSSSNGRKRFINEACTLEGKFYKVIKLAKCRSASAAACYVTGCKVDYTLWVDSNGKHLKDCYPQRFFMSAETPPQNTVKEKPENHLFYLRQDPEPGRFCDAKGWYNPDKQYFIIKAGSVISRELAPQYKGTPFENQRSLFVSRNCLLQNNKLVVQKDVTINSPTMAACHVTGRVVKNRTIWTDEKGLTIDDIYGMK